MSIDRTPLDDDSLDFLKNSIHVVQLLSINGSLLRSFEGHSSYVFRVNFSPDGKIIASASADNTVKLWSLDGHLLKTLQHRDHVIDISFSPDSKIIATAGADKTVNLWSIEGKKLKTLKGHKTWVGSVSFSPDGKMIASGDPNGIVKLWSFNGTELKTLEGHGQNIVSSKVRFSPDSQMIVSAGFKTIKIWKIDGTLIETIEGHNNPIYDVTFSPDGKMLASAGGMDGTIKLWKFDSNKPQTLSSGANSICFSPDSETIALINEKDVKLYSPDGILVKIFEGHNNQVNDVSFSSDGKMIASVSGYNDAAGVISDLAGVSYSENEGITLNSRSQAKSLEELLQGSQSRYQQFYDRSLKLWSIDGKLLKTIDVTIKSINWQGHRSGVTGISFSPNGRMIASSDEEGIVNLWDINGTYGNLQRSLKGNSTVWGVRFSPDSKTLAVINGTEVELLNLGDQTTHTLRGHSGNVISVSFSPDAQMIASTSFDKTVKLWKGDGSLLRTFDGYKGRVKYVTFSPDGQKIATAGDDGIYLWNLSGELLFQFGGTTQVNKEVIGVGISLELNQNTRNLTVIKVFNSTPALNADIRVGDQILAIDNKPTAMMSVDDALNLLNGEAGTKVMLRISNPSKGTFDIPITRSKIKISNIAPISYNSVSFSPNAKRIVSADAVNTVKLWSSDGKLLKTLEGHNEPVFMVSFSPNGKTIASASFDKTVKLWNVEGILLKTLDGHGDRVMDICFSPDSQIIASASSDGIARLWRIDGTLVKPLLGNVQPNIIHGNPQSVSFNPNNKTLALGNERDIEFWSIDGHLLKVLSFEKRGWFTPDGNVRTSSSGIVGDGHENFVKSVTFSPDGTVLASASADQTIKLWRIDGTLLKTFKTIDAVNEVRFSPDGKMLVSAGNDQTVRLWNFDGTLLRTLRGHNGWVNSVSFSPDNSLIASGSQDKTIKLWNSDGTLLKTFSSDNWINKVSFSPDGKTLATASIDKVTLWNFDLDDLMVRGCNWVRDYLKTNPNVSESDRHLCDGIATEN